MMLYENEWDWCRLIYDINRPRTKQISKKIEKIKAIFFTLAEALGIGKRTSTGTTGAGQKISPGCKIIANS